MSLKRDFYEGVGSAYDLHGRNHFNDFNTYPGPKSAFNQHWENVRGYIGSSVNKFASDKGLPSPHVPNSNPIFGSKPFNIKTF